ncbi:MAG: helix-turn-helix transcriptional regulator [Prevotella sp.]|nr:helix-turn-helix transcriptional regulator [Prevotella sp.]
MEKKVEQTMERLKQHRSATPSQWREKAEWRLQNRTWLRHSQHIAMLMLDKMEELNMTQKELAEQMGCSQQYVSKVLKGHENLSLETMAKIEDCLNISILKEELV